MYTLGSLFTGIGGIDLAFEWSGFEVAFQVEIDDYCNEILQQHWPTVPKLRDVRTVTGRTDKGWRRYNHVGTVDVLAGGFPCQDISVAGKGAGLAGARSGLWFEYERLISELRPRVVFLENVPAIAFRGGTTVTAALAQMGYVGAWGVISAADAGASHRRERWWCVAYANSGHQGWNQQWQGPQSENGGMAHPTSAGLSQRGCPGQQTGAAQTEAGTVARSERCGVNAGATRTPSTLGAEHKRRNRAAATVEGATETVGDSHSVGLQSAWCCGETRPANGRAQSAANGTIARATQPGLGKSNDGLSTGLDVARPGQDQHDWEAPRTVAPGSVPHRASRLKSLGNAVVPQVVYPIAVEIMQLLVELDHD